MNRDEAIRAVAEILTHEARATVVGRLEYDSAEDIYRVPVSFDGVGSTFNVRGAAVRMVAARQGAT